MQNYDRFRKKTGHNETKKKENNRNIKKWWKNKEKNDNKERTKNKKLNKEINKEVTSNNLISKSIEDQKKIVRELGVYKGQII